jgi:hypothetical protein
MPKIAVWISSNDDKSYQLLKHLFDVKTEHGLTFDFHPQYVMESKKYGSSD